jgi:hypothetical protein
MGVCRVLVALDADVNRGANTLGMERRDLLFEQVDIPREPGCRSSLSVS